MALSQDATASRDDNAYTFTNCGQVGYTGPSQSQCNNTYNGTSLDAGYHSVVWNADSYSSGVYFVKMVAGNYVNTQKLMLVK